jgi:hypothetical protein
LEEKIVFILLRSALKNLKYNHNLILNVVEGGNHRLEIDNERIKSIEILKSVISSINEF